MTLLDRIAAAPISWGVCEVPGWGYQLDTATVLGQMRGLGVSATEFGPDGFLPDAPDAKAALLAEFGLGAVGGFVPVVLHEPEHDPLPEVDAQLGGFIAAGASQVVLAASTGADGYDVRPVLDERGWFTLLTNLDRIAAHIASRGMTASLHPHVGTMVESAAEIARVLNGCGIGLCLDTGHIMIGGGDPVALARDHAGRVAHVHLKDVRRDLADQVRRSEFTYTDAVRRGLYVPLGRGDAGIAAIVRGLDSAGYGGYYVMEQDAILAGPPQGDAGPVTDVAESISFLRSLTAEEDR